MTKTKRKSTTGASDRKQTRLLGLNSAPRKSVRQKARNDSAAAAAAAAAAVATASTPAAAVPPADEHSQLILDRFGFENPSPPSVPPPSSKKKQKARKAAGAASKKTRASLPRRSPRLRRSLSLIEEAEEEDNGNDKEEEIHDSIVVIPTEEDSPVRPPNKRRKVTEKQRPRLIVRDTYEGTPDSEDEELSKIGDEVMAIDDASWRPPTGPYRLTRSSARQTPSSRQRKGKDEKAQDNTLTQMARHFGWNLDDVDDDDDYDSDEITVLSPSKPPNILKNNDGPRTPQRPSRTVIPSSTSTAATPLSILRSGGKMPRSLQNSPSKKVRWIDEVDQENKPSSPVTTPDTERVIPSSQWWEREQDLTPSQWDVDEVPAEDDDDDDDRTAVVPSVLDDDELEESQFVDNDDIPKTSFSTRLQQAAEVSPAELRRLSPERRESLSPTPEIDIIKATPDVEVKDTPTSPRRTPTQQQPQTDTASAPTTTIFASNEEIADSQDEGEEEEGWEFVPEQNVAILESQVVVPASVENTESTISPLDNSNLPASSPPSPIKTPVKSTSQTLVSLSQNGSGENGNDDMDEEGLGMAASPDLSVIFQTPTQSQHHSESQLLPTSPAGITQPGGSSQFWDLTGQSSGLVQSSPPPPHSSFTQQGYTQWKLNKFGPTQPSLSVSQILGHSYSQEDGNGDEAEVYATPEGDSSKVQVQSSMIGSEL